MTAVYSFALRSRLLSPVDSHAISTHDSGQWSRGHRRAQRRGVLGRRRILRQDGEPRRIQRAGGRVALPRAHDIQGDDPPRCRGRQPRLRPRGCQAQRTDVGGRHLLPRHLPARVLSPGFRRPGGHPPANSSRRRLRDREASDHRGNPDVPGQPDVRGLRGGQGRPLRLAPARQQHSGDGRVDQGHGRPTRCATISRSATARPTSCWHLPARPIGTRWSSSRGAIAEHGRAGPRPGRRARCTARASFRTILRADDQQQTVVGVCDGPPMESEDRYPRTCWRPFSATIPAHASTGR